VTLSHLHLHVKDRPTAERFYEEWFGMTVVRRLEQLSFLEDRKDFLLALMDDAAPQPMPPWFHFGFRQDAAADVSALHNRLRGAGIEILKPLYQDDDYASFRCADSDGYAIEVFWERS